MKASRMLVGLSGIMIAALMWLFTAPLALAKGPPDKVTITGPGLKNAIEITNRELLPAFGLAEFEDVRSGTIEVPKVGEGYEITSYFKSGSTYRAFDRARYHPDPAGGRGYVFYIGIVNGWSEYDGKWFHVSEQGEQAMQRILAEHGVQLASVSFAAPAQLPVTGSEKGIARWLIMLGGMASMLGGLLGLGQRQTKRES
ncbi:MAG TPA: hypothetical protein DEP84_01955 [Chloroflexi bacterium]|nr:hypothetical protein [Chloroflexota bacterium]